MNRPEMVTLLLELGADPLGVDASGNTTAAYARSGGADLPVMEAVREMTQAELRSAEQGHRGARARAPDMAAALALGDWKTADRLARENPALTGRDAPNPGVLHLMAKRGDTAAVKWLLDRGSNPSARWAHWDADVTPLHLAILADHPEVVRLLLDAGADPTVRDSKHDSDALGWATFFRRTNIIEMLKQNQRPG
jgi:hypothetical protein